MAGTPARRLRALLGSPSCECLLEAHNAVSAAIVQEAGLPGIWASSLTLSSSFGLRDDGLLTMTQALEILESMTARVAIPVLFDGDAGYGDYAHFQQLVQRLGARRVAGVCIEDKAFPKRNSFVGGEQQELAPVEEFCAKLRAGCDARADADFVVVARTEALISGLGLDEALRRAERYAEAGADAVLVHSKAPSFAEVAEFMRRWDGRAPVVCAPTTYYATPPEAFQHAGVSLVLWANHLMRAAVDAMQRVARRIRATGSARDVEETIAPLAELLRLHGTDDRRQLAHQYGPEPRRRGVVLAASSGAELLPLTADRPKCMIPISGRPVIEKVVQHLRAEGVREIGVVRGYRPEALQLAGVTFFDNPRWAETGELWSLAAAEALLQGDVVIAYGDVLLKRYILHELLASPASLTVVVDGSRACLQTGRPADRVRVSAPPPARYDERDFFLQEVSSAIPDDRTDGEWVGLLRTQGQGTLALRNALRALLARPEGERLAMDALLNELSRQGEAIRVLYIWGDWADIDVLSDVTQSHIS